ncbi:MAG: cyanophycin synthetase, partial [Mannheimia varigena]|nr:cyanophycin synthetase [Mannheimia varigena]
YNANVDSMISEISVILNYRAFLIFDVGDMAELGEVSAACHQEVADFAKQAGLDLIVSFGKESAVISQNAEHHFTDKQQMVAFLMSIILQKIEEKQPLVLLAKGSRSKKMETVISELCKQFNVNF